MIRFECDYAELVHPKILELMTKNANTQFSTYSEDIFADNAKALIKKACNNNEIDVHFFVGGTQTNKTAIASALRPHECVIAPVSGHIATHETGAIENTGHKVVTLETPDGKLTATQIKECFHFHDTDVNKEHVVKPRMVYISNPTEYGTIYSKQELTDISNVCKETNLLLYVDGARLAYALEAENNDVSLQDLTNLCDMFYIGGTKVGAMIGEAIVIVNDSLKPDFRYLIKQAGGLLAKGYILGMQFTALFEDNLYFSIGKKANQQAARIKKTFIANGFKVKLDTFTNQIFIVLPQNAYDKLAEKYTFSFWEKDGIDNVVRFCTSFATTDENVDELISDIKKL